MPKDYSQMSVEARVTVQLLCNGTSGRAPLPESADKARLVAEEVTEASGIPCFSTPWAFGHDLTVDGEELDALRHWARSTGMVR